MQLGQLAAAQLDRDTREHARHQQDRAAADAYEAAVPPALAPA
jgi:hypothetical protein